ncbi:hypothetical protein ACFL0Y_00685 [Patescibacteria group bacterium]
MSQKQKENQIVFHDLLNFASSIRNILYIVIMKKNQPDKQTEEYLKDCLNRCNQLITELQGFQKDLKTKSPKPSPKQ